MREHLLYIGGAWRQGGGGQVPAVSPSSGEHFASVASGDPGDVDAAVAAISRDTGWHPSTNLAEALPAIVQWAREERLLP